MTSRPTLPFPPIPDLRSELARLLAQAPAGSITTYGDLARALGSRHAAIWTSKWVREQSESDPSVAARVVGKGGVGTLPRFAEYRSAPALDPLKGWLQQAARFVDDQPLGFAPKFVAGIDVAYPAPDRARAAGVLVDVAAHEVIREVVLESAVSFPYITGFLTFRELPAMAAVLEELNSGAARPDVVMIDGQGRLHPERGGVATGFAAATGVPTIGVAKSLICGRVEEGKGPDRVRRVLIGEEHLGFAVQARAGVAPIYVSVGGWLSLEDALGITLSLMGRNRLPLPTHRADRLSKATRRQGE